MTGVEFIPVTYYIQARLRALPVDSGRFQPIFARYDALLMATAPGEAPEGLASTGDATLLSPWIFLGFPAISVNGGLGPGGLSLGLQLVGGPKLDYQLLQTGYRRSRSWACCRHRSSRDAAAAQRVGLPPVGRA